MRDHKTSQLVEDIGNGMSRVTGTCRVCEQVKTVEALTIGLIDWWFGEFIQNTLPDLSDADREFLMTQTCSECFDAIWQEATA